MHSNAHSAAFQSRIVQVYLTERAAKKKEISIRKEPDSTIEQPTKRVAPAPLLFTIINST
jgi:hypothetical protein